MTGFNGEDQVIVGTEPPTPGKGTLLKGYRTFVLAAALAVWGIVETVDTPGDRDGWTKLAIAIVFALLRVVTTTPPLGKQP